MIALLLALAPVVAHHPELTPCVETKTHEHECRFVVDRLPAWDAEAPFRVNMLAKHLECGPRDSDRQCWDIASRWNNPCVGPKECGGEDAYCIWRSDGAVEAKNAVCSDRKGERQ